MKKNGMISIVTISILTLSILSFGLFSWSRQNKAMDQAFAEIVPILHASYAKGGTILMISEKKTDESEIETVSGIHPEHAPITEADIEAEAAMESESGTEIETVSGIHPEHAPITEADIEAEAAMESESGTEIEPVQADEDKGKAVTAAEKTIVFGYETLNPNAPDFILNGTMTAKYRIQDVNGEVEKDANGVDLTLVQKGATMVETFNMDDGKYKASFTFAYPAPRRHSGIPGSTYSDCIHHFKGICMEPVGFSTISDAAQATDADTKPENRAITQTAVVDAAEHWSKVEFTYEGKTITLNKKQINTLLGVVKG